jgi:hypothetical protein
LYALLQDAYEVQGRDSGKSLDDWVEDCASEQPTFKFWLTVLNLEILLLTLVRAIRSGDYALYKWALSSMMPWYFFTNRTNYSRYLSLHLKDLSELEVKAPDVHQSFMNGNF